MIYIHIPFCKQACHYCDFHFSTSLKRKDELLQAIVKEIKLKKQLLASKEVETVYFGGGTPSLLSLNEINLLVDTIYQHYNIVENPEITLEANPDDLSKTKIIELANSKVNRLSIGVQSFFEEDLQLMNRAHNVLEAKQCLEVATQYFNNISIDLIYGIPGCTHQKWKQNIKMALSYNIPHISSYALTVEDKTPLQALIQKGKISNTDDTISAEQFEILITELTNAGFIHYELSNFGKKGFFSKNNSGYWLGNWYLGFGPSAHSFYQNQRCWNINNNNKYIQSITNHTIPEEIEKLSKKDQFNETIMVGLRTIWGIDFKKIEQLFGAKYELYLRKKVVKFKEEDLVWIDNDVLKTTKKGKFLADGIASDLFMM